MLFSNITANNAVVENYDRNYDNNGEKTRKIDNK